MKRMSTWECALATMEEARRLVRVSRQLRHDARNIRQRVYGYRFLRRLASSGSAGPAAPGRSPGSP